MSARLRVRASTAVVAAVLAGSALLLPLPGRAAPTPTPGPTASATPADSAAPDLTPVDVAVVVDESSSIRSQDMVNERAAASVLVQGEPAPGSRALVLGFGSSNGPGQSPVDEVCPLTPLDAAGRERFSACVGTLRSRRPDEGQDTDFPAAIRQAVRRMDEAGGNRPKLVFFLTDGRLNVPRSPDYGPPDRRNAVAARRLAEEVLPEARRSRVQIWPLGFGPGRDLAALRSLAAGGYQNACPDRPSAVPTVTDVTSSDQVAAALQRAYAAATCSGYVPGEQGTAPGELHVDIPALATDGSITVTKRDPRVSVEYFPPETKQAVPAAGERDGSRYEISGRNTPVEVLKIRDPIPGRWTVRLIAPGAARGTVVSTSAIWRGVLRSSISMNPPQPTAGERVVVDVRLQTRRDVVLDDPQDLAGVTVSVRLLGAGIPPARVVVRDDGVIPDARARDGRFTGFLVVPARAVGPISLVGESLAPGVTGDRRPLETVVVPVRSKVTAAPTFDDSVVFAGEEVRGSLVVRNDDGRAHRLRLSLADLAGDARIAITPVTVQLDGGTQDRVAFTLRFGRGTRLGVTAGRLVVIDETEDGREVGTVPLAITVEPPPSWWDRNRWYVLAIVLLVVGVGAALFVRRRMIVERIRPDGLELILYEDGLELSKVPIRSGDAAGFGFAVVGERGARGLRPRSTGARHVVRRTLDGGIELTTARGDRQVLRSGARVPVGDGVELGVVDARARRSGSGRPQNPRGGAPPPRRGGGASTGARGAPPPGGQRPSSSSAPTMTYDPDL